MVDHPDDYYEVVHRFDDFMNELIMGPDLTVRVSDVQMILSSCFVRLRAELSFPQTHKAVHALLHGTEAALQDGTALADPETGESVNMVLAEEREVFGDAACPDTVPEDWT